MPLWVMNSLTFFFEIGANILGRGEITTEEETAQTKDDGWWFEITEKTIGQGTKDLGICN